MSERRQTPAAPERFRPPRPGDALRDHRRGARHLVRAAAAACAAGAARVKGRQWDYPFGANLNYIPRSEGGVSFAELRALADALPLLRAVIETRKDQIAALNYTVRARDRADLPATLAARSTRRSPSSPAPTGATRSPTGCACCSRTCWSSTRRRIYPRFTRGGALYSLDVIDGATIKPLIGEDGRSPEPPDPGLSADPARRARRRLLRRRAPLSAAQRPRASALRHEPGRADRADRQHRAEARRGDARLLPRRLVARRLRHPAEGMDGRPDPLSSRTISTR